MRKVIVAGAMVVGLSAVTASQPSVGMTAIAPSSRGVQPALSCPRQVLSGMNLAKRVGQLFVAGVSSTSPSHAELRTIRRWHLGGVILMGHTADGVAATSQVSKVLQRQATRGTTNGVRLWVSVDQEGGYVQVLSGPGFSTIPTALDQGSLAHGVLRKRATRWGRQLAAAGVNLDLAPVMDTVPAGLGTANKPIGFYYREYGHTPGVVAGHGTVVSAGLAAAGVQSTAKHFPGLGRVRRNTDTDANVVDRVTTRHDRYLLPFEKAIEDRVPVVMVSLARYALIDRPHVAAFSHVVMRGMLRRDLRFRGVIISDSMTATAVHDVPVADRGLRFLRAGGTVVLSVTASSTRTMAAAVLAQARTDAHFRATVRDDALTVLRIKHRNGLLPC